MYGQMGAGMYETELLHFDNKTKESIIVMSSKWVFAFELLRA